MINRNVVLLLPLLVFSVLCCAYSAQDASPQLSNSVAETQVSDSSRFEMNSEAGLVAFRFEGRVLAPNGSPALGALVVSSAGGQAVVDDSGNFVLNVQLARETTSVQVTAIGRGSGNPSASQRVLLSTSSGRLAIGILQLNQSSVCLPSWLPTFGGEPGMDGAVKSSVIFNDGSGPALYIGGDFSTAGGASAAGVAKWTGSRWQALGDGLGVQTIGVKTLIAFDDGSGESLYAGGCFRVSGAASVSRLAKWNGVDWEEVGGGVSDPSSPSSASVNAMMVFDDGSGEALFVGGLFTQAGPVGANNIAKWNGFAWRPLGGGMGGLIGRSAVNCLALYDDGGGRALYAGGQFMNAGSASVNRIAKWTGSRWAALGGGLGLVSSIYEQVDALNTFDDGSGQCLYAAGSFTYAGSSAIMAIAKWDGLDWTGVGGSQDTDGVIRSLSVYDDGSGIALYVGGYFSRLGGVAASNLAMWDGMSWRNLGKGRSDLVYTLIGFDDGGGKKIYVGTSKDVIRWNGTNFGLLAGGLDSSVNALAVFDDGNGPALYAGGRFILAGRKTVNGIAKWEGNRWVGLVNGVRNLSTPGLSAAVYALEVFDDGAGEALYVGGAFTRAGSIQTSNIAKWDGSAWSRLAGGVGMNGLVRSLVVLDTGGGDALYAGGSFTLGNRTAISRIGKWDGSIWAPLGSGMSDSCSICLSFGVLDMAVYDDGTGLALYAGGDFISSGGVTTNCIAKWDGVNWSSLNSGLIFIDMDSCVHALAVFDDGSGEKLIIGGEFLIAGASQAISLASWDGSQWNAFGGTYNNGRINSLEVMDDGSGLSLFAGGDFDVIGGAAARRIAKWDGVVWEPLGSGMLYAAVNDLIIFDDGNGDALVAGGSFPSAIDSSDSYIAKWGCPDITPPVLSFPASVAVIDKRQNGPGEIVSFTVSASDNLDPAPSVTCTPASGSYFPRGITLVTCKASDASGNEIMAQFEVRVERMVQSAR